MNDSPIERRQGDTMALWREPLFKVGDMICATFDRSHRAPVEAIRWRRGSDVPTYKAWGIYWFEDEIEAWAR